MLTGKCNKSWPNSEIYFPLFSRTVNANFEIFSDDALCCVAGDWYEKIASYNFLAKMFGQVCL